MNDYRILIKEKRIKLGLSQHKLARLIDKTQSFIYDIESGRRNPSFKTLTKICDELNIEIKFIDKEIDT